MLIEKEYIDRKMVDETRYKKPIGIYWAQVFSNKLLGVSVSESDCLWPIDLSVFPIEDCSNPVDLQFDPPLPQEGIPPGQYSLNYLLSDFCGNQSSGMLDLYVIDDTPPSPDLIDTLFVELLQGGGR